MNLRFVEAFVWVVRLKSITRAAEKLCLTQSAVSNRISALEDELGVQLIDRRVRAFHLTRDGVRFLRYAERLLALQQEVKCDFGAQEPQPASLRVGGIETVLLTWLVALVARMRERNPRLEFELTIEMTQMLNEQIRRGGLDLVFSTVAVEGGGLRSESLPAMEMVLVAPPRLAGATELSFAELQRSDLLTFQRGSQVHTALLTALRAVGLGDKRVHTVSSIAALINLVEGGVGIATLPRVVADLHAATRDIVILPSVLALAPLPVYASYWASPVAPELEAAIIDAIVFIRSCMLAAARAAGTGVAEPRAAARYRAALSGAAR